MTTNALTEIELSPTVGDELINQHYKTDPLTQARESDSALDALSAAALRARRTGKSVAELAKALASDPTLTPAAAALALRDKSEAALSPVLEACDSARARTVGEIDRINAELDAMPSVNATEAGIEAEIRAHVSRLDFMARTKFVQESDDDRVLSAILRAPAMLSGMTPEEREFVRLRRHELRNPGAVDRIGRLKGALETFDMFGPLLLKFTRAAANADGVKEALAAQARTTRALERTGA